MPCWILFCLCCVLFTALQLALSDSYDSTRPLMIALPIRIQAPRMPRPMAQEDRDQEDSEEEQQREQRLVPRMYNPNAETQYSQQQEENTNTNSQSSFLTWNPGNKFMVLQINDFIGAKQEESSESEENERVEEPMSITPRQNWAYQGAFDFEDSRRIPGSKRKEEKSARPPALVKKRKKVVMNSSVEDTESDVYGTDPVVHYLRNKNKKNDMHFDFSAMPDDTDEEFNFREWWKY